MCAGKRWSISKYWRNILACTIVQCPKWLPPPPHRIILSEVRDCSLKQDPYEYTPYVYWNSGAYQNVTSGVVIPCIHISITAECSWLTPERTSFIEHNRRFAEEYPDLHSRQGRWKSIFIAISVNISFPPLYSGKKWDGYWSHDSCPNDKLVIFCSSVK